MLQSNQSKGKAPPADGQPRASAAGNTNRQSWVVKTPQRMSGGVPTMETKPKRDFPVSRSSPAINIYLDSVETPSENSGLHIYTVIYRSPGSGLLRELPTCADTDGSLQPVTKSLYRESAFPAEDQEELRQPAGAGYLQLDLQGPYATYQAEWDACMAGLKDFSGSWNLTGLLKSHGKYAGRFGTDFSSSLCTSLLLLLPSASKTRCTLDILDPVPGDDSWVFERITWVNKNGIMSMLTFAEMVHWAKQFEGREVTQKLYASYDAMWLLWVCHVQDVALGMGLRPGVGRVAPVVGHNAAAAMQ